MDTIQTQWESKVIALRKEGKSHKSIAKITGKEFHPDLSFTAELSRVRRLIHRFEKRGILPKFQCEAVHPTKQNNIKSIKSPDITDYEETNGTVEYKSADGSMSFERVIAIMDGEPITPEIVMKAHNIDTNLWEVVTFKNNFWQSQAKGGKKISLYQSKITVKPKLFSVNLEDIKKHFDSFVPKPITLHTSSNEHSNTMIEVNICDLHLGKLAWNGDIGEDYDYKIATKYFNDVIQNNIKKIEEYKPEKILLVWCNDFFNADGISESTTKGTPQSCDLRWQKLFMVGCDLLVNAIETLRQYAPVESFYIASNHARQAEFYALCYLSAWFKNTEDVIIHTNCKGRYYYKYGINMIGFSHSSFEKKANLSHLMSTEEPKMWAETKYREFHLGHFHREAVEEECGVILRWLPALTGTDNYHYDRGYLGAVKRSFAFVWDKNKGLVDIFITNKF